MDYAQRLDKYDCREDMTVGDASGRRQYLY